MTALHLLTEATCREGLWRYACSCTATFEGPDRDETVAEDLRFTKARLGLPLRPAWVERLRRWVHVALFGWSS